MDRPHMSLMIITLGVLAMHVPEATGTDWAQWRGNAQRTALSPLPLDFDQVGIRWRFPTGAATTPVIAWDLNQDGTLELLSIEGGRVIVRRQFGALLWDTPPVLARRIVRIDDIDSDGTLDVLVDATNSVVRLNAVNGEILWQSTTDLPIENIGSLLFADTTGDNVVEAIIADVAGNAGKPYLTGAAYIFDMAPSATPGLPLTKTEEGTRDYESGAGLAIADVDLDQVLEIVAPGKSRLYSYDAVTGLLEGSSPDYSDLFGKENLANARTYIKDVTGDGLAEVFLFVDSIFVGTPSRRLVSFSLSESKWLLNYTLAAPDVAAGVHAWPAFPVNDLDSDGSYELVTSFFTPQSGWETWIVAASTGDLLLKLPGRRTTAIFDPDSLPPMELLTVTSPFQVPGEFATRHVERYTANPPAITSILTEPYANILTDPYPQSVPTGPQIVVIVDTNQDGFGDIIRLQSFAPSNPLSEYTVTETLLHTSVTTENNQSRLVLSYASGEVALLDSSGGITNDVDGNGHGDVVYQGFETRRAYAATVDGKPLVSVAGAGGRVTVLDAATGDPVTPPVILLQTGANLPQIPLFMPGPEGMGILVIRTDDNRQLVFRRVSLDGTITWDTAIGGTGGTWLLARDPLVADTNDDGYADLIVTIEDKTLNQVFRAVAIDGATGTVLWTSPNIPAPGGNVGWLSYLTAQKTIFLVTNATLLSLDAKTGAIAQQTPSPAAHYYGIPSIVDVDGDGTTELALLGTSKGVIVFNNDLTVRWEKNLGNMSHAPGATLQTPTTAAVALAYSSSPRVDWLSGDGTPLFSRYFINGTVYVSVDELPPGPAKSQIREIIAVDQLNPSGDAGFIVATSDGFLHAVTVGGTPMWSFAFDAGLGSPAIIDADTDGIGELVIPAAAGTLALIDRSTLPAPAWAYENDGSALADTPDQDIDIQSSCTEVSVNWDEVPGAAGYLIRLLSAHGSLVSEQLVTGGGTSATLAGLSLVPGQLYRVRVAGYEIQNNGKVLGASTDSDGVRPQDNGPPQILSATVTPALFFPGTDQTSTTELSAIFADDKALDNATITIGTSLEPSLWTQTLPLQGTWVEWSHVWGGDDNAGNPMETGTYDVHFSVTDQVGGSASTTLSVTLCRPPWVFDRVKEACVLPTDPIDVPDVTDNDSVADAETATDLSTNLDTVDSTPAADTQISTTGEVSSNVDSTAETTTDIPYNSTDPTHSGESGCGGCHTSPGNPLPNLWIVAALIVWSQMLKTRRIRNVSIIK